MSHTPAEDGRSPHDPEDSPSRPSTAAPGYPDSPDHGTPDPYAAGPAYPAMPAYGAGPYEVNPYQASYGGQVPYGATPPPHPRATPALILGIIGVALLPPAGIVGLVLGVRVRKDVEAEPYRYSGRGMGTAALVLGIVSAVIGLLEILVVIFLVVAVSRYGM